MQSKISVIILIMITILSCVVATFFGVKYFEFEKQGENETIKDEVNQSLDNSETTENEAQIVEVEKIVEKVVEKVVEKNTMLKFDYTKGKNIENVENYNGRIAKRYYNGSNEFLVLIDSDGKAVVHA